MALRALGAIPLSLIFLSSVVRGANWGKSLWSRSAADMPKNPRIGLRSLINTTILEADRCVAPRSDTLSRVRIMAILGLWPSVRHPGRSSVETTILDGQKTLAEPT